MKKWIKLLCVFSMVMTLVPTLSLKAAHLTLTYATAYDENGKEVVEYQNGDELIIEADEIPGMKFTRWSYDGHAKFADKEAKRTTVTMGNRNTEIWANYTLVETVWLNGVYLTPNTYLPSNSTKLSKEKPTSGGYAYYAGDGQLLLHNYQLAMQAPTLDSLTTENNRYALRTYIPLIITLEGDNSIKMIDGDCVYVAIGGAAGSYLTFEGDDDATLDVASGEDVGIRCIGGITINGGNIITRGIGSDRGSDITVNGGTLTSNEIFFGHCNKFIINDGTVYTEALNNITNIVMNGGNFTGLIHERVYGVRLNNKATGIASEKADGSDPVEFVSNDLSEYKWLQFSADASGNTQTKYNINIVDGLASTTKAVAGTRVVITAKTPQPGYAFDKWITSSNVSVGAPFNATTKFVMPEGDVSIQATYKRSLEQVRNVNAEVLDYKDVELSWNEVDYAKEYRIYRKEPTSKKFVLHATTNNTSYVVSQKTGKEYRYQISAADNDVESVLSDVVSATTILDETPQLAISKNGNTRFELSWTKVAGATRYIVYRKRDDESFKKVLTLSGSTFEYLTSELPKGNYEFIVKAGRYDSSDRVLSQSSNIVSGTSVYTKPVLTLSSTSKQIKASWNKVEGVIYYQLYRATSSSGKYTRVTTTKETSVTFKDQKKGSKYYFKVRGYKAYNGENVYTSFSSAKAITVK